MASINVADEEYEALLKASVNGKLRSWTAALLLPGGKENVEEVNQLLLTLPRCAAKLTRSLLHKLVTDKVVGDTVTKNKVKEALHHGSLFFKEEMAAVADFMDVDLASRVSGLLQLAAVKLLDITGVWFDNHNANAKKNNESVRKKQETLRKQKENEQASSTSSSAAADEKAEEEKLASEIQPILIFSDWLAHAKKLFTQVADSLNYDVKSVEEMVGQFTETAKLEIDVNRAAKAKPVVGGSKPSQQASPPVPSQHKQQRPRSEYDIPDAGRRLCRDFHQLAEDNSKCTRRQCSFVHLVNNTCAFCGGVHMAVDCQVFKDHEYDIRRANGVFKRRKGAPPPKAK